MKIPSRSSSGVVGKMFSGSFTTHKYVTEARKGGVLRTEHILGDTGGEQQVVVADHNWNEQAV
jgi:hypothetical protein